MFLMTYAVRWATTDCSAHARSPQLRPFSTVRPLERHWTLNEDLSHPHPYQQLRLTAKVKRSLRLAWGLGSSICRTVAGCMLTRLALSFAKSVDCYTTNCHSILHIVSKFLRTPEFKHTCAKNSISEPSTASSCARWPISNSAGTQAHQVAEHALSGSTCQQHRTWSSSSLSSTSRSSPQHLRPSPAVASSTSGSMAMSS